MFLWLHSILYHSNTTNYNSNYNSKVFMVYFFETFFFVGLLWNIKMASRIHLGPELTKMERTKPLIYIVIGCIATRAGFWQIKRKKQKDEYLNNIDNALERDAIKCPMNVHVNDVEKWRYQKVFIEGKPLFDQEIVVGPKKPPKSSEINTPGRWGGYIYTPVMTRDNELLLINRGWIPEELALHNDSRNIDITNMDKDGYIRYEGLFGKLKPISTSIRAFNVNQLFWPYISKGAINAKWKDIGIHYDKNDAPIIIDAMLPKTNRDELPKRFKKYDYFSVKVTVEQHQGYVITWFGLAFLGFYYAFLFWRNPKAKNLNILKKRFKRPKREDMIGIKEQNLKL